MAFTFAVGKARRRDQFSQINIFQQLFSSQDPRHRYHKNGKKHIEKTGQLQKKKGEQQQKCSVFHAPTVRHIRDQNINIKKVEKLKNKTFLY